MASPVGGLEPGASCVPRTGVPAARLTSCAEFDACSGTTAIPKVESTAIALGVPERGRVALIEAGEPTRSGCTARFVVAIEGGAGLFFNEKRNQTPCGRVSSIIFGVG